MQKCLDVKQLTDRREQIKTVVTSLEAGIAEAQKRIGEYGQAINLAKGRLAQLDEVESWLSAVPAAAPEQDYYEDSETEFSDEELEELTAPMPARLPDAPEAGTPGFVRPRLTKHRGK